MKSEFFKSLVQGSLMFSRILWEMIDLITGWWKKYVWWYIAVIVTTTIGLETMHYLKFGTLVLEYPVCVVGMFIPIQILIANHKVVLRKNPE